MHSKEFAPIAGKAYALEDGLRMILAPNPSPMTHLGTNTYLLGSTQIAVIDPGPDSNTHLSAILDTVAPHGISHIIVTHNHLDHSPLAKRLAAQTGAKIHAFGTHLAGRSSIMVNLAANGLAGGGEGIDHGFIPDIVLKDGDRVNGKDWSLTTLHTPGHIGNHLSFAWNDAVFTGDHVMGWASSLVSPPDGDLTDFMQSCEKLQNTHARVFYAGHGAPIYDPRGRLLWLINHRNAREAQILASLSDGEADVATLTRKIYTDIPTALVLAAERNVFAHLVDLYQKRKIIAATALSSQATFRLLKEK
tara:strand:+ start:12682 stop:13596 length:915 start_codon:yes stop_codon:yes gene_type:complete